MARGIVSRLQPGLYVLVPPEMGSATEFSGNPYLVARELIGGAQYYISHGSAMELHRMVTQPQFVLFTSTPKRLRDRIIHGTEFQFVFLKPEHFFGMTNHWITKQESVHVSDIERTIIDGLRQPEYCGGITEVAKGMWIRRSEANSQRLVDYALRLQIGAVIRRLGYLLELYKMAPADSLLQLRKALTRTYVLLDPVLPREGPYLSTWNLRLNIPTAELLAVRAT